MPPYRSDDVHISMHVAHPEHFKALYSGVYQCLPCGTTLNTLTKCRIHEATDKHVRAIRMLDRPIFPSAPSPTDGQYDEPNAMDPEESPPSPTTNDEPYIAIPGPALPGDDPLQLYDDWGGNLGEAMSGYEEDPVYGIGGSIDDVGRENTEGDEMDEDYDGEDGNGADDEEDGYSATIDESSPERGYESGEIWSDEDENEDGVQSDTSDQNMAASPKVLDESNGWFPWPSKEQCLLDVMSAFPRALFSESELEITMWFSRMMGITGLPSMSSLKRARKSVMDALGAHAELIKGKLGHWFALQSPEKMIADEFANPLVSPHIARYPEDSGAFLGEARQSRRWRHEVDPNLAAPMARNEVDKQDYYVYEPALVDMDGHGDLHVVMPVRWFERKGKLVATVHRMCLSHTGEAFIIDGRAESNLEIPLEHFLFAYPAFKEQHTRYQLPHPDNILGIMFSDDRTALEEWSEPLPNPWRTKAGTKRCYGCPVWLYCDDTSGNVSKKWNKHNSFLFVLAGLQRSLTQLLYNINFLATSNLAPPLEMLEGIRNKIQELQEVGIEAYDYVHDEVVLLIVWIFAMQGDNPMQAELSSGTGLQAKCFCRVCKVRGKDKDRPAIGGEAARLQEFMQKGEPRDRAHTLQAAQEQLDAAMDGVPSRVDKLQTATGVKDTFLLHFLEQLRTRGSESKKAQSLTREEVKRLLAEIRRTMPDDLFNPAFSFPELDPNQDTPVEILHVILLGFVKYFWRDAVSRQKGAQRDLLKTRLNSLDVQGLGLSPLRGHTLVQYAGSLNGGDFWAIVQVAPLVLYDLIPEPAYRAWLALGRLAPLVFQPEIIDKDQYSAQLTAAISDFLEATALWTPRWFNKPKFHILLHLVEHILRFGPAVLFATEAFESYNFVIRLRSVMSQRHAPSLDIGNAFGRLHMVRHLVSGGRFLQRQPDGSSIWCQAGAHVIDLRQDHHLLKFMGMPKLLLGRKPKLFSVQKSIMPMPWFKSQSAEFCNPPADLSPSADLLHASWVTLRNGDRLTLGGFALLSGGGGVAQLCEILVSSHTRQLVGLLVSTWDVGDIIEPYGFPAVRATSMFIFIEPRRIGTLLCAVQCFHNCAAHNCEITLTKVVVQERVETEYRVAELNHINAPRDRLLNLAQLHSARYVQSFQPASRYPNMTREEVIARALTILDDETRATDEITDRNEGLTGGHAQQSRGGGRKRGKARGGRSSAKETRQGLAPGQ